MTLVNVDDVHIGIIGLGYVGLPLAVHMAHHFPVVGFDIDEDRVRSLRSGVDHTREVTEAEFAAAKYLSLTSATNDLARANFFIVSVPTPINQALQPDLRAVQGASETVGTVLKRGDVVVYESTVYPGVTEDVCVPILEKESGLSLNRDFFAGYSPERINPGDHARRLPDIVKITAGSTPEAADLIDAVGGRGEADLSEANKLEIAKTALAKLLKPETLDGLTELLADMAGLDVGTVDDMPPADTFKLAEEAIGFFSEALSSLGGGE